MTELTVNGRPMQVDAEVDTPLLWVLREQLGLTGTKYGCGVAICGACTVLLDGRAVRACITPLAAAAGREVLTIEGLSYNVVHPLQQAWIELEVPQCGYCQSGQLLNAFTLLAKNPRPSDAEIDSHMSGNLCRCGTYNRIRQAIHRAAQLMQARS